MRVLDGSPLGQRDRLERLYRSDVFRDPATPATAALASYALARLGATFPEGDPLHVHELLPNAVFFRRLTALRHALLGDPEARLLVRDVLASFGWDLERTYFDRLRLRAVPSGGHRLPEARESYLAHRDTWYANPPAQANLWIAVRDVAEQEAFGFHSDYWERPIANSSASFDYGRWNALGGWQVHNDSKHYPTATEELPPAGTRLAVPAAATLLFSGTHLHGTAGHDSGRTRWSLEIRTVLLDDVTAVQPRRNLDNRSTGTTLRDFLRASDFTPFPEETARAHEQWSASETLRAEPA